MSDLQAAGVVIRERRSGAPIIRGIPTAVGAMLGTTERGQDNKATHITSFAQFVRIFGSYQADSYLAESVEGFFGNGGSDLWIVRVVHAGGTNANASLTMKATGAAATLDVTAIGYGDYGNAQSVEVLSEDTLLAIAGAGLSVDIPLGAVTDVALTPTCAARVTVGDQLVISDGITTLRVVVAKKNGNSVTLATAGTTAAAITKALAMVTLETFSLSVKEAGYTILGPLTGLRMSSLSLRDYFVTRINTGGDENVVTVSDLSLAVQPGDIDTRPVNTVAGGDLLIGGVLDTAYVDLDYTGDSATGTGLYALDLVTTVRMVAIPGVTGTVSGAVSKALLDYCTLRIDCVALLSTPINLAPVAAVSFIGANVGGSSYGLAYYPWVQILSPLTNQRASSPPDGYVMGMIARTDMQRVVAKAPAGELVGRLNGTIGMERLLSGADKAQLYVANINPIEDLEGVGQSVMGSRTLENGEFNQVNVRRTFIYFETSLQAGTRFVLFEPNDPASRNRVRRSVLAFLRREWKKGNLEGATLGKAAWVVCDASNNPDVVKNVNHMALDIGVRIPNTTEILIIQIRQDQRAAKAAA